MTRSPMIVILVGVAVALLLFFMRPPVDNGHDPYGRLTRLVTKEMTPEQRAELHRLESTDDPQIALKFWDAMDRPEMACIYAEQVAASSQGINDWLATGDYCFDAMKQTQSSDSLSGYFGFYLDKAESAYQQVLNADSNNRNAKLGLANIYTEGKGDIMQGVQIWLALVRNDSTDTDALMKLGRFAMMSGQYNKAIERFEAIVSVDSTNADALISLGNSLLAIGANAKGKLYLRASIPYIEDQSLRKEVEKLLKET